MTELNAFRSALAACLAAPAPERGAPTGEELALLASLRPLDRRGDGLPGDLPDEVIESIEAAGFDLYYEDCSDGGFLAVAWLNRGFLRAIGAL